MDETKLSGALPNLNVEITHRTAPDGSAEHLTIQLTATPDFQSMLPLLGGLGQMPLLFANPMALWAQAAQAMMAQAMGPWANMAQSNPFASLTGANPLAALISGDFSGKDKK